VGAQEVRLGKESRLSAGDYIFFCGKENENHQLGTGFFLDHKTVSEIKKIEFISDKVPYIVLRGRWCDIIVLNVHAPSEKKVMIQKRQLL